MSTKNTELTELKFLIGGGEMSERIRTFDWTMTPLGPIEKWPQSLKTSVGLMLNSQHPMWIGWGNEVTFLYNDAYIQVLSLAKHPWALGRPTNEVWAEIWDICGPLAHKVFDRGEASFLNDVRLFMNRGDFIEETFYSFSYSPLRDESGNVGGLFCPSAEVTSKVLNTRRLRAVSELAAESLLEKSTQGACASAAAILGKNFDDVPFVLIYLIDPDGKSAYLEQAVGLPRGDRRISPESVELGNQGQERPLWPLQEVATISKSQVVSLKGIERIPLGAAEQRIADAIVLPLVSRGQERPVGIMVAGINPTRKLDSEYRTFYELVAGHIATAIQNARAVEEEKRRADMLAELDRAKTTFFSNVSHELRTPLTLILGPLEDEMRESPLPSERLNLIHRNSLRLLRLVNTLLDFSRIEAGRVEASFESTDLPAFTSELASVFRSGVERVGLRLVVDCPALPEPIYIDRNMWEKIVFNLLSNALKFTACGEIEIKLREDNSSGTRNICLSVRDTGIGIPEAELPRVFERFHRMKNTWARSHEGTGIGLALVQELARLHGGSATVASVEGQGTTFSVIIPAGMAHLPRERITTSHSPATANGAQLFIEEALRWLPADNSTPASAYRDELATAPNLSTANGEKKGEAKAHIILADDNSDMRGYIHRLLTSQGYEVTAVGDGEAALEAAHSHPPSLVLSDVMMPRLDGLGLLKELRNDPALRGIPIILLSARAGEEARVEGVEAGADDYLTKPFSARELLARVTTHLELARVRREAQEAILEREERLRRSEALYRAIGESNDYGVWVCDAEGRNTYASESFLKLLGITQEECSNFGWGDSLHPDDVERTLAAWKECVRTGTKWDIEHRFRGVDGQWHYILARGVPVKDEQGKILYWAGINLDISHLKQTQEELAKAHRKLQTVLSSITDGLVVVDKDWRYTYFSKQAARIVGMRPEDLLGKCIWDVFPKARGTKFYEEQHRAVETGCSVHFEEFYPEPLNKWIECHCYPSEDGLSIYFHDVTERKTAENALRDANAQLADKSTHLEALVQQRTAKLRETVGELEAFSYSIAHDMRAPLRSLQGFSDILLNDYTDKLDADGQRFLRRIAGSAGRMDKLIQDVLNYSRVVRGELPMERVDLDKLLHGIVDTYPTFAPSMADIEIQGPLPAVLGNEAMLTQIFSNLIGNAIKFVAPGVKPRVRVWAEPRATHVKVFVEDNGIGIEVDQHEKIFSIFQKVNKEFDGTGIGLAIVKKAVNRMGGKVGLQSELDRGSTFWIEIQAENAPL